MTRRYTKLEELAEAVRTRHEQREAHGTSEKEEAKDESGWCCNHREQPLGLRQTASLPIPHTIQ